MILPTKHIRIGESLLGLGAFVLRDISHNPKTIDELFGQLTKFNRSLKDTYHGIDNLVLTLDFLFIIGAIGIDNEDRIYNEATKTFVE